MSFKKTLHIATASLAVACSHSFSATVLVNGDFEQDLTSVTPNVTFEGDFSVATNSAIGNFAETDILGWETTAADNLIEIWRHNASGGGPTKPSFEGVDGTQFAEINANIDAELFQTVTITSGDLVDYVFYHRGRNGSESLRFRITDLGADGIFNGYAGDGSATGDDVQHVNVTATADNTAWTVNFGNDVFTADGGQYRFGFETTSPAGSEGNFLDAQAFGEGVADALAVPEPSSAILLGLGSLGFAIRRRRK